MKKTAKSLALLLVLVMAFSLVACKGGDEVTPTDDPTQSPGATDDPTDQPTDVREADLTDIIPEETVTLTVYSQLANFSGEQVGWFAQIMKEKFNVVLNIINEGEGTFATRMESGDLGDIVVFGNDADEYLQAVEAGMLFDWEEDELLDEFGPYIKANMEKALEKNKNISGGNLYGFGHNVGTTSEDHEAFFYRPDIRWDLYKELGYPEVNTLEDFIDVLEEMVKLEPKSETGGKTYGVSMFSDWDGDMVMFVKSTAALYGYDEFGFGLFDTKTRTYEDCLKEGGQYLRALKFYNQLYQRGLLDPDSMTQTYDEFIEKYQTGAAFFTIFDWMGSGAYNSEKHLSEGKAMM
ncbi:MAG: extracellular solute-binding protein, partial [Caldicoprobacterales bacterium]